VDRHSYNQRSVRASQLAALVLCAGVLAGDRPIAAQAPPASTTPSTPAEIQRVLTEYRHRLADWAGLTRYGSDDAELPPPAPGERRVVFLGDQVTEAWSASGAPFFPGRPYLNRGIANQTTGQMLVRFRQDVIALSPAAVVIQAGTNDLAGLGGPGTKGTFGDNILSMIDLAKAHGIRVVLASITPVCDCTIVQTARRPQVRLAEWNDWLKTAAHDTGSGYLDYYAALTNGRDFKPELTQDGLLPNAAGYRLMAPLAEQAVSTMIDAR
jgi:lysophospholipase L1-like esterase